MLVHVEDVSVELVFFVASYPATPPLTVALDFAPNATLSATDAVDDVPRATALSPVTIAR